MARNGDPARRGHGASGAGEPIRVLHLITNAHAADYFPLLVRHADRARFHLRVGTVEAAGDLHARLAELDVPTLALGAERREQYPRAALGLARWLRGHRVDVLHAHLLEASLVGLLAARLAGTPLGVFTGHHSHEVPLHQRRALLAVDRFAARRLARVVVAPSREMGETFVELYGCDPGRVEVIEHGFDLDRFDPRRGQGAAVRAELGLEGKLVIGAVSKHFWIKNLDALVRAFAPIAAARDDAHLIILGIGDASTLAALVDELGIASRVSVLEPRPDVPDVLAAMDVFVHPALAESFGFAIVEAMAMERPVVVRPVGIARDVVHDGVSGFRVDGTDAESLRAGIERALAARGRWPELGAEARRRALRFTPERWVRAHERMYADRLGRGGSTR